MGKRKNRQTRKAPQNREREKPTRFVRDTWIEWEGDLIRLRDCSRIYRNEVGIALDFPEGAIILNLAEHEHVIESLEEYGPSVLPQACDIIFGWLQTLLLQGGANIVDITENAYKLSWKTDEGQVPIDPAAVEQQLKEDAVAAVVATQTPVDKPLEETAEFDADTDEIDEEKDNLIELAEEDAVSQDTDAHDAIEAAVEDFADTVEIPDEEVANQ